MQVCLEVEAVCPGRVALPLPRAVIGVDRGIEAGRGCDELCWSDEEVTLTIALLLPWVKFIEGGLLVKTCLGV